jgi:hypothetical protein
MIKTLSKLTTLGLLVAVMSGCAEEKQPEPANNKYVSSFECKQENVLAPKWTCIPEVTGYYAGVGIAEKSLAGVAHMRKVALMNGRSDLAQQIKSQVKDKMEGFTKATGNGNAETVDTVTTSVTKQVAKVNLAGSKAVDMWNAPSGAMYLLVTVPEATVNKVVKKAVKEASSSFKNDNALWQQFQSQQALEALDNEFPTE